MAKMSEQVREVALSVADRLALFEGRVAEDVAPVPVLAGAFSAGIADSRGTGSSFAGSSFAGASLPGSSLSCASDGAAAGSSPVGVPLSVLIDRAGNDEVQALLRDAARARSEFDAILAAGAVVIAKRSERVLGYAGLAQSAGDRTAVDMVQRLTGSTRVEAFRQVKLGGAMGEADAATTAFPPAGPDGQSGTDGRDGLFGTGPGPDGSEAPDAFPGTGSSSTDAVVPVRPVPVLPWHEPLTRAVRDGILRTEAVTIVMRGLGEPNARVTADTLRAAAVEIVADAAGVHADELGRRARQLRDEIDPDGVRIRWDQRYENRTWRFSRNPEGARTAWVQFDEESAAWVDAIVGAAMRPRRGGPRFVDPVEAARAEKLRTDRRSNDQIVFDVMMDLLRAGSEADKNLAFGSRQPGVRVIITKENLKTPTTPTTPTTPGGPGGPGTAATGSATGTDTTGSSATRTDNGTTGTTGTGIPRASTTGAGTTTFGTSTGADTGPPTGAGISTTGAETRPPARAGTSTTGVSTAGTSTIGVSTPGAGTGPPTGSGNGYFEETGDAVPGSFIDRQICISGITEITVDEAGTPLDVGREERCFTTKQRIALAIRDGGCEFLDCDRPPSYTEAHHIHEWADGGKTDLADGILMCRKCHMLVHNNGWKITRDGTQYFAVPPPDIDPAQKPIPLRSKSALARARRRAAATTAATATAAATAATAAEAAAPDAEAAKTGAEAEAAKTGAEAEAAAKTEAAAAGDDETRASGNQTAAAVDQTAAVGHGETTASGDQTTAAVDQRAEAEAEAEHPATTAAAAGSATTNAIDDRTTAAVDTGNVMK